MSQTFAAKEPLTSLTANVVSAYVKNHVLPAGELPNLIAKVHLALAGLIETQPQLVEPEKPVPAVPIRKSVQADYIISLEDGRRFKSLRRHLLTTYGMTADEYRAKWGLPHDYPMVAPSYAARRSELAKSVGLGRMRKGAAALAAQQETVSDATKATTAKPKSSAKATLRKAKTPEAAE